MNKRRGFEAGAAESDELDRLCEELGHFEAPFDEESRNLAPRRAWAPRLCASPHGAAGARWGGRLRWSRWAPPPASR